MTERHKRDISEVATVKTRAVTVKTLEVLEANYLASFASAETYKLPAVPSGKPLSTSTGEQQVILVEELPTLTSITTQLPESPIISPIIALNSLLTPEEMKVFASGSVRSPELQQTGIDLLEGKNML